HVGSLASRLVQPATQAQAGRHPPVRPRDRAVPRREWPTRRSRRRLSPSPHAPELRSGRQPPPPVPLSRLDLRLQRRWRKPSHGPRKPMSWLMRLLLGVGRDYEFRDDWTTHFSPVYSVYDHWWADPVTNAENKVRWRLYIFFTPLSDDQTALTTFAFTRSRWP